MIYDNSPFVLEDKFTEETDFDDVQSNDSWFDSGNNEVLKDTEDNVLFEVVEDKSDSFLDVEILEVDYEVLGHDIGERISNNETDEAELDLYVDPDANVDDEQDGFEDNELDYKFDDDIYNNSEYQETQGNSEYEDIQCETAPESNSYNLDFYNESLTSGTRVSLDTFEDTTDNYIEDDQSLAHEFTSDLSLNVLIGYTKFAAWFLSHTLKKNYVEHEPRNNIDQFPVPSWINPEVFYAEFIKKYGAEAKIIMGNTSQPVYAEYFVIHDTAVAADFSQERISRKNSGIHLWINDKIAPTRDKDWSDKGLGTKLERRRNNCFLHTEVTRAKENYNRVKRKLLAAGLAEIRRGKLRITNKIKLSELIAVAPNLRAFGTYYTDKQYELLAYAYLVASIRKGQLLTVTIHREVDRSVIRIQGSKMSYGHNDPQFFDIEYFYKIISKLLRIPGKVTFGIQDDRVMALGQGNRASRENVFFPYVLGKTLSAKQYGAIHKVGSTSPSSIRRYLSNVKHGYYYNVSKLPRTSPVSDCRSIVDSEDFESFVTAETSVPVDRKQDDFDQEFIEADNERTNYDYVREAENAVLSPLHYQVDDMERSESLNELTREVTQGVSSIHIINQDWKHDSEDNEFHDQIEHIGGDLLNESMVNQPLQYLSKEEHWNFEEDNETYFDEEFSLNFKRVHRKNKYWGKKLKWRMRYDDIKRFLTNVLKLSSISTSMNFAQAVAAWQDNQRIKGVDGIIGPKTWSKLEAAMDGPKNSIDTDIQGLVEAINKYPKEMRSVYEERFGSDFQAELLRTLAAWRVPKAQSAYEKLMRWNLEYFYKYDATLQKRFIHSIASSVEHGSYRVRGEVAVSLLTVLREKKHPVGAQLLVAKHLSLLIEGKIGVYTIRRMLGVGHGRFVRRLLAHILIWDVMFGQKTIGKLLGQTSHEIGLRVTKGVRSKGGSRFSNEEVFRTHSILLGRIVAHIEMAVDDWASIRANGKKQASAAHGAGIVNFAIDSIMDILPVGVIGKLGLLIVKNIRKGVSKLKAYESMYERPPKDPRNELNVYMLDAAKLPLIHMLEQMENLNELEEEERQVIVEQFRLKLEAGRNNTWSERSRVRDI